MNDNAIVTAEFEEHKTGLQSLGTPQQMMQVFKENKERLEVVHQFVKDTFVLNQDYGKTDSRSEKPTLRKEGAEKLFLLFNVRPRWRQDDDTHRQLGSPDGTVCLICELVDNATGRVIGEGRGTASNSEKTHAHSNTTIKKCEKRALVDATIYAFGLSGMFTQDLEKSGSFLSKDKQELYNDICDARAGIESSMNNADFMKAVAIDFCHGAIRTVGAVRALRKAVLEDGLYCLETGERIPQ